MKAVIDDKIPFIKGEIEKLVDETVYLKGSEIGPKDVADADILVVRTRTHCNETLLKDSRVRFIVTATIGHDHLDKDYLKQAGIQWTNCPGCNASSVCQYIHNSLLVLGLLKKGLTVGVVGVGHVGTLVANDLEKKGLTVLRCDPPKGEKYALPQLAELCDIITFHTPLTKDGEYPTYHMADDAFFASLRKKPLIINSSRGPVVDNEALLHALESGQVSNAVIDTWEGEPNLNRQLLAKAIIATPHIAGYSREGKQRGTAMMLTALNGFYGWDIPVPTIDAPATGAAQVTLDGIAASYDIMADTAALKAAPHAFESQRNHYPHRPEYQP